MIHSMTGYATASLDIGNAIINFEIKSVNSRYLDISFRLGEELRFLEMPLREKIAERIGRGKLECRAYLVAQPSQGGVARERMLNVALLAELSRMEVAVRQVLPHAPALTVAEVLRWPGMLAEDGIVADQLQAIAMPFFSSLLDDFVASREREGGKLADVLFERVNRMREQVRAA